MVPIGNPKTSILNHLTPRNNPEDGKNNSVGLPCTSDRFVAEACNSTQQTQETNIHAPNGIRTRYPSTQPAADPRHRPLGDRDRLGNITHLVCSEAKTHPVTGASRRLKLSLWCAVSCQTQKDYSEYDREIISETSAWLIL
jgi:hypothetical protein